MANDADATAFFQSLPKRRDEPLTAIDARQITVRHAIERLKQIR